MVDPSITSRFNEIYDSTNRAVLAFVTAKCGNIIDISDIVQDTYMELYRLLNKRGVDYIKNSKAMVLRIAKQKISRHYSLMDKLRHFVPMFVQSEDGGEIPLSDLEAESFLTEDFMADHILLKNTREFIKQKPEDVKKVFFLFYDAGQSIPEIAQALSMSESNVKNKLYRTIKELRTLLQ